MSATWVKDFSERTEYFNLVHPQTPITAPILNYPANATAYLSSLGVLTVQDFANMQDEQVRAARWGGLSEVLCMCVCGTFTPALTRPHPNYLVAAENGCVLATWHMWHGRGSTS